MTVRRPGYRDLTVVVDGTKTRVEAKLRRITGPEPARSTEAPPPAATVTLEPSTPIEQVLAPSHELAPSPPPSASSPATNDAPTPTRPAPQAVLQPPDAIDPAWGFAPIRRDRRRQPVNPPPLRLVARPCLDRARYPTRHSGQTCPRHRPDRRPSPSECTHVKVSGPNEKSG